MYPIWIQSTSLLHIRSFILSTKVSPLVHLRERLQRGLAKLANGAENNSVFSDRTSWPQDYEMINLRSRSSAIIQEKEHAPDEIQNAEIATTYLIDHISSVSSLNELSLPPPSSRTIHLLAPFFCLPSQWSLRILILVVLLMVASSVVATTPPPSHPPPPPVHALTPKVHAPPPLKPVDTFSLKCVIHNIADRRVTFSLEVAGKSSKKVVAEKGCWTAIAPVPVNCKATVVHLCATVKTNKGVSTTKSFPIHLLDHFKFIQSKSLKVLPVLAYDTRGLKGGKFLEIKIGHKKILSFKL